MEEKLYLVNEEGEIINEIDTKDGDRIIVDRKSERDNKIKVKQFIAETTKLSYGFVKVNANHVGKVVEISPMMCCLFPYVGYIDNVLKLKNGTIINMRHIERILKNWGKESIRAHLAKLEQKDIIRKHGRGEKAYFVVNPWICYRGKRVSKLALEEFKDSEWRGDVDDGDDSI